MLSKSISVRRVVLFAIIAASQFVAGISIAQAATKVDKNQALIKAASAQFQLSYRRRPAEGESRQEQLKTVVAAWRAAPRNEANDEQLTGWLREAIRASMPGSREPLPPVPPFDPPGPRLPHVTDPPPTDSPEPAAVVAPSASADKSDPFRDDPLDQPETKK
jgi:hypothetical protein